MKNSWSSISSLCAVFLLGCVARINAEEEQNGYIFTCPKSLKIGATNQLQLRRYGNLQAGNLNVKLFYKDFSENETLAAEKNYEIEKGAENSNLDLFLDLQEDFFYSGKLTINGVFGDYAITGSDSVYFKSSKDNIVVIQTDKPLYKKGQIVKFRVLNLNKELKPVEDEDVQIWIEDPFGTRLFQWNKVSLETGLTQLEFALADESELGNWDISVSIKGEITSESFKVAEYRLPQYEVTIATPPFVLISAEEIPISVCAKYSYGKSVQGNIHIRVSFEENYWSEEKLPASEYKGKIDGCIDHTISLSSIQPEEKYMYYHNRIQIFVGVEDFVQGVQRNTTEYIQRQSLPLFFSFGNQKEFFKPGLPYNGKLSVTHPDGTPAEDEPVEICYIVTRERVIYDWLATKKVQFCKNYTSDFVGIVDFTLPPQNTDSISIKIEAKSLKYVPDPKEISDWNSLTQPERSTSISPWYSPSGSFVQLQPVQGKLSCRNSTKLKLLFTSKTDADFTFNYQVLSQGKVTYSGSVKKSFSVKDDISSKFEDESKLVNDKETVIVPSKQSAFKDEDCQSARETRYVPPVGEVYIDIPTQNTPSASLYVLAYYIRDDRETVADSQKLEVAQCFKNQVKLQFGDAVKQPGTKTSIRITSSPNSLCGIKVVDKGISLLDSNEPLTKEAIFRTLESMDSGTYYGENRCNSETPQPGLHTASSSDIMESKHWSSSSYQDSIAAFENAGFLVISDLILFTRPCEENAGGGYYYTDYDSSYEANDFIAEPRYYKPVARTSSRGAQGELSITKSISDVRSYFPETWLFELEMTGPEGEVRMKERLPDTITEWVGDAFCINNEDGLGISNKARISAFQAFFISLTLPYSVIRGEMFWITISIFNYVEDSLPITVSLPELEGFEVLSESIDGDICVHAQNSTTLKVQLKANSLGERNIVVEAKTAESSDVCESITNYQPAVKQRGVSDVIARDAIKQPLIVEAEGWAREEVESTLFCPKSVEDDVFTKQYSYEVPDDAIENSPRVILDITGNVLGKSLDNLDKLVTLPTGCGEQNMVKFVPNVVAMNILTETNELTDKLRTKLIRNLNAGVQNQMNYMHYDGSFSAFGMRDREGSMFLTAFVLRYFSEASQYITIDDQILTQMQEWIISNQQDNGCFLNTGNVIVRGIQGGIGKKQSDGTITAYVLASLLISNYNNETVINLALSCIKENSEDFTFYSNFLYSYAEALAGETESAEKRITVARERAIYIGDAEYYQDVNASRSESIETVAYAVLSILKSGGSASMVLPLVRYLTKNMNSYGGFYSTQDTCIGLDALGEFSKLTASVPVDITVKITGSLEKEIEISDEDKLVVKRQRIPDVPSEIQIKAEGSGCAIIQSVLRYNSEISPEQRNFKLNVEGKCSDNLCKQGTIAITISYLPEGKKTGMSLVEVKMISGIVPDEESLENLKEDTYLELMRFDVENNVVVFYFNEITNTEKRFSFMVTQLAKVDNYQPGTVKVYDYYNRDISGSTTYALEENE